MRLPWTARRPVSDADFLTAIDAAHGRAVRAFLRTHWRDPHQIEDLTQEVLMRAWRSVEILRRKDITDHEIRAWLLTTTRRVVIDRWRAEQRRPTTTLDQSDLVALAPADEPLDRALDSWLVAEALSRLSPDHRAVVTELFYRDRTVAETAQLLGIPEGTVKSRSYYAVRALRTIFDELGVTR
ncbi:sigma-70 family RNA polymerase sigma factor [Nocardia yamanashiensis]|uniref:sigma-70 family RNA polymerase sigma factor n=1 Tax=Nocardia yamanashiensis TaxID=209247 RepID=UPI001E57962D|nr:sigma-70 family RNA polymerase sigma factor [Nocardia yamanashiensis]UGT40666.1 sigma-70 family RNA polymerase sigma factor [Nocardia yamanashiensis]